MVITQKWKSSNAIHANSPSVFQPKSFLFMAHKPCRIPKPMISLSLSFPNLPQILNLHSTGPFFCLFLRLTTGLLYQVFVWILTWVRSICKRGSINSNCWLVTRFMSTLSRTNILDLVATHLVFLYSKQKNQFCSSVFDDDDVSGRYMRRYTTLLGFFGEKEWNNFQNSAIPIFSWFIGFWISLNLWNWFAWIWNLLNMCNWVV